MPEPGAETPTSVYAPKRDEAPEHERVRQAGDRPFDDRLALKETSSTRKLRCGSRDWSTEKVLGAAAIRRTRVATCAAKAPSEHDDQQPEGQRLHLRLQGATSAGTISNRSPTIP